MIKRVRRLPGGTYRLRSDGAVPCMELPSHIPNDLDYDWRSEEHTSELQSLMRISYAVFCLKKKKHHNTTRMKNKPSTPKHISTTTQTNKNQKTNRQHLIHTPNS